MPVFSRSTVLAATPAAVFTFHENPHNLRAIIPPGLEVLEITARDVASPGEKFTISIRQRPFTLRWTGRWEQVEAPRLLVDSGVRCPFRLWRHSHLFEPCPEGTRMTDRIEFRLPWHLGGPLGDWFVERWILPRMFASRHAATGTHLGKRCLNEKDTGDRKSRETRSQTP